MSDHPRSTRSTRSASGPTGDRPVVILTALNLEYEAIRAKLTRLRVHRHPAGTRFEIGWLADDDCEVVLALVGKGNHPAAVLAERAIAEFAPVAVIFAGVAGALWPAIALGDVVVATHVYAYHGGTSEDDGLKARPRVWEIAHGPDQIARYLARSGSWARHLPAGTAPPRVRFGPIAAGEVVQDSVVSDHARWVRAHYNDALAIEMEAAGVAQAAHLNNALPVIVVRGISDRADGTKTSTDGENWQPRAAANAAGFAAALAAELAADRAAGRLLSPDLDLDPDPARARNGEMITRNIATGNARVGVQAGRIYGNITIGAEPDRPADLATGIAELRQLLKRTRSDGQLDEVTYAAAEAELAVAGDCLQENTPQGRNSLLVALKRLRGLVAEVSELASRVAAVIAVAKALT